MTAATVAPARARAVADLFTAYLETGRAAPGLFAPDVFVDFTMPTWRLQARGVDDALALRRGGHPGPGRVLRSRFDPTPAGFVLEVEESWDDAADGDDAAADADAAGHWYCRELFRADLSPAGITELAVYCTGDWSAARVAEHARTVALIRP
jgi:hypothetical protein